jgi:hypothetical protein
MENSFITIEPASERSNDFRLKRERQRQVFDGTAEAQQAEDYCPRLKDHSIKTEDDRTLGRLTEA